MPNPYAKPAIDALWSQFRTAIDTAYKGAPAGDLDASALRDYAENVGWHDALGALEKAEQTAEREHRALGRRLVGDIGARPSTVTAARILLLHAAAEGASRDTMPRSIDWLMYRRSRVEAELLGYLIRAHVTPEWVAACAALDYSEAVKSA